MKKVLNNKKFIIYFIILTMFGLTFFSSLYIFFIILSILFLFVNLIIFIVKRKFNVRIHLFIVFLCSLSFLYHYEYNNKIKAELIKEKNNIIYINRKLTEKEIESLYEKKIIYIENGKDFTLMKNGIDFNTFILKSNTNIFIENED